MLAGDMPSPGSGSVCRARRLARRPPRGRYGTVALLLQDAAMEAPIPPYSIVPRRTGLGAPNSGLPPNAIEMRS